MSVGTVTEINSDRASDRRQTKPTPPQYEYHATRVFQVPVSDVNDTPIMAETANGIPQLGEAYPGDDSRRVVSVIAKPSSETRLVYVVTCEYSTTATENNTGSNDNPLAEPAEIIWDFEESNEPRYVDGNGYAILNSAGMTFDPPPTFIISDPVLIVSQNLATFSAALAIQYKDAVNSDYFFGPPGQAKCKGRSGSKQFRNNVTYWRVTTRIVFREVYTTGSVPIFGTINPGGWYQAILDEGKYTHITPSAPTASNPAGGSDKKPILDSSAKQVIDPVRLDGEGNRLPQSDPYGVNYSSVFRFVPPFKSLPFAALNLPV